MTTLRTLRRTVLAAATCAAVAAGVLVAAGQTVHADPPGVNAASGGCQTNTKDSKTGPEGDKTCVSYDVRSGSITVEYDAKATPGLVTYQAVAKIASNASVKSHEDERGVGSFVATVFVGWDYKSGDKQCVDVMELKPIAQIRGQGCINFNSAPPAPRNINPRSSPADSKCEKPKEDDNEKTCVSYDVRGGSIEARYTPTSSKSVIRRYKAVAQISENAVAESTPNERMGGDFVASVHVGWRFKPGQKLCVTIVDTKAKQDLRTVCIEFSKSPTPTATTPTSTSSTTPPSKTKSPKPTTEDAKPERTSPTSKPTTTTTTKTPKPTTTTPKTTTTTVSPTTTTTTTSAAPPPRVNMVDDRTRGIITAVVTAVVAVVGVVAAILHAIQHPRPPQAAAVPAPPAAEPPAPRTGPPACDGKLCAEFLADNPQQGRLKVTFTPERDLPHGFLGVVTGPGLELTGRSAESKGANATYTGFFDVGNGFRKDEKVCTKVFAIDQPGDPVKQGEQIGKEVCVVFLNDPQ